MSECILCSEPLDDAPIVGTSSRGGKPSRRVACVRCALVQVSPQPQAQQLADYYESGEYRKDHGPVTIRLTMPNGEVRIEEPDSPDYADAIAVMHKHRAAKVVDDLKLPKGARVLEIGCGDGSTLRHLQALGMDVFGIEPDQKEMHKASDLLERDEDNDTARVFGMTLGHNVPYMKHYQFDAVVAFHVLEHFTDPLEALSFMRSLLKPGGKVWLEVPNVYAPGMPLEWHWQWVHLYDFSYHTLVSMLGRAGFDSISYQDEIHGKPHALQAWAVSGDSKPRPFEDHGGMRGEELARQLRAIESGEIVDTSVLPAFMSGMSLAALGPDAEVRLRNELDRLRRANARLATAYREAVEYVGHLSQAYQTECFRLFEQWRAEPYAHGELIGRANALYAVKDTLALAANAMKMVELTDAQRDAEG